MSVGKPGTPLPATKADRQNQKVGLGNLSLNSPNTVAGNMFQDLDCNSKCVPLDEFGQILLESWTLWRLD